MWVCIQEVQEVTMAFMHYIKVSTKRIRVFLREDITFKLNYSSMESDVWVSWVKRDTVWPTNPRSCLHVHRETKWKSHAASHWSCAFHHPTPVHPLSVSSFMLYLPSLHWWTAHHVTARRMCDWFSQLCVCVWALWPVSPLDVDILDLLLVHLRVEALINSPTIFQF